MQSKTEFAIELEERPQVPNARIHIPDNILPVLCVGSSCRCNGDINLDLDRNLPIDVAWNLNRLPYPFADKQFRKVLCHHVLEHLDYPERVLDELLRIGKLVEVRVPNRIGSMALSDPTHKWVFNRRWFWKYAASRKNVKVNTGNTMMDWSRFNLIRCPFPLEFYVWLWK